MPVLVLVLLITASRSTRSEPLGSRLELAEPVRRPLVDVLHGWDKHSLTPDTSLAAESRPAPQGFRLHVRSHQVLREALEREELAADESDVRSDSCVRIAYDVVGGRFTRISEGLTEGGRGDGR